MLNLHIFLKSFHPQTIDFGAVLCAYMSTYLPHCYFIVYTSSRSKCGKSFFSKTAKCKMVQSPQTPEQLLQTTA